MHNITCLTRIGGLVLSISLTMLASLAHAESQTSLEEVKAAKNLEQALRKVPQIVGTYLSDVHSNGIQLYSSISFDDDHLIFRQICDDNLPCVTGDISLRDLGKTVTTRLIQNGHPVTTENAYSFEDGKFTQQRTTYLEKRKKFVERFELEMTESTLTFTRTAAIYRHERRFFGRYWLEDEDRTPEGRRYALSAQAKLIKVSQTPLSANELYNTASELAFKRLELWGVIKPTGQEPVQEPIREVIKLPVSVHTDEPRPAKTRPQSADVIQFTPKTCADQITSEKQ